MLSTIRPQSVLSPSNLSSPSDPSHQVRMFKSSVGLAKPSVKLFLLDTFTAPQHAHRSRARQARFCQRTTASCSRASARPRMCFRFPFFCTTHLNGNSNTHDVNEVSDAWFEHRFRIRSCRGIDRWGQHFCDMASRFGALDDRVGRSHAMR